VSGRSARRYPVPVRILSALLAQESDCVSVIRLINDWLQNEHVILSQDLLIEIKDFVSRITADNYTPDGVVLHIVRGIQAKVHIHISSSLGTRLTVESKALMNLPPPPITSSYNPAMSKGPTPKELAFALTALEAERYRNILPSEYIAFASKQLDSSPNLSVAIDLNKRINYWVQSSILDLDFGGDLSGLEKRSEVKQFFVRTANVMRFLMNKTTND
jgi:hypothetical protein